MTELKDKDFAIYVLWAIFGALFFNRHSAQFDELLMLDILRTTEIKSLFYVLTSIETQLPLSYLWTYVISEFFVDQLWAMRLPSLLFTLLTPIPLYFWAKEKLGGAAGKFVCLMWMFSFPTMYYFYSIRPYSALIFFFVCFLYFFEAQDKTTSPKKYWSISFGILMGLVHPVGFLLVMLSLTWSLFNSKHNRSKLIVLSLILTILLLSLAFVLSRIEDLKILGQGFSLESWLRSLYLSMGFVFSGAAFAVYASLIAFNAILKKKCRGIGLHGHCLYIFISTFAVLACLQLFTSLSIGPRHFIVLVPLLLLALAGLLFNGIRDDLVTRIITYVGILLLIVKSFVQEGLLQTPPNLNSAELATKVYDLSGFNEKVVSCGNCPSYYIRDNRLICLSSMEDLDLKAMDDYFVFIEYVHEKEQCDSEVLGADYLVTREMAVEGALVKYYEKR